MSEAQALPASDRLPWLADEPKPKRAPAKRSAFGVLAWFAVPVLLVAAAFFWLGSRSDAPQTAQLHPTPPSATVPLPQPLRIAPQPEVAPAPMPEVRPAPAQDVHAAPQRAIHLTRTQAADAERSAAENRAGSEEAKPQETAMQPAPAVAPPVARPQPLRAWQPRVVIGAAGRLVEVGAFGTVQQAKLGWRYMVRAYPAVAHLPAVVRPDRNSRGRYFYRFRVGTTSQAHSEILCQRMQRIHLSCAVVGLPWKAKVER